MLRYKLRTLLIVLAIAPPIIAGIASLVVWAGAWLFYWWVNAHTSGIRGFAD